VNRVFVDTGAFVARAIARDAHHAVAMDRWASLGAGRRGIVSSEHVFDETLTLIARRVGYPYAADWGDLHLRSARIEWLRARPEDLSAALTIMRKFADQSISFTDCVSFVLMRRERIKTAFSFDRHFGIAGFESYAL
jgi:uncharacterized protein